MASASILYPQNSEYYYYKENSGGVKKYFSVDGQNIHKKHIEKIITSIQNYDPAFMKYHLQKEMECKKKEMCDLRRKKQNLENILKEVPKKNLINTDYQKDLLLFYYIKNGAIYDYRTYISETTKQFLKEKGKDIIMEDVPCYNIPMTITISKIKKEDDILKEKFSQTNTVFLLQFHMDEIEKQYRSIQKRIKEMHIIIQKIHHIPAKNIEKLMVLYQKEKELLNFFRNKGNFDDRPGTASSSNKEKTRKYTHPDLLISLGIKDKQTFRLWIKTNHPDKHQQSKDIEHITKLFTEVTEAGRVKGYLSSGSRN